MLVQAERSGERGVVGERDGRPRAGQPAPAGAAEAAAHPRAVLIVHFAHPQLVPNGTAAARIVEAGDAACDGEAEQQDIDAATPAGELVGGDDDQSEDWAADVDADEAGGEAESESRAEGEAGVVRVRVGASSSSSTT